MQPLHISRTSVLSFVLAVCLASQCPAQISTFSEDFEGLDMMSPSALGDAGWEVFANVFDSGGGFLYNYGPDPAPNGSGGFSNIATDQGGPDQGDQQLVVFNDYNNADHNTDRLIEANVFREFTIAAEDVGLTYRFAFDAKLGDIQSPSMALAFIKTIDPNDDFALTNFITLDTTGLPVTWGRYSLDLTIEASLEGQIFQVGFLNTASQFTPSGIFYDNTDLTAFETPVGLESFFTDLEDFDEAISCPNYLTDLGFFVFGAVTGGASGDYTYGPFVAPTFGCPGVPPAFSGVRDFSAGDGQFSLNIFNDYQNGDHQTEGAVITSTVFRESFVGADDVGATWDFDFDYTRNIEGKDDFGPSGGATTQALIRVLDAGNFGIIAEFTFSTTEATSEFQAGSISVEILPDYSGQLLQYGFESTANGTPGAPEEGTGILYDNVSFAPAADCILGDLNGDGVVTLLDVDPFVAALTLGDFVCEADVNEDGMVSLLDVDPFVLLLSGG